MSDLAELFTIVGTAVLLVGIALLTWLGWLPQTDSGTPRACIDKRDLKNVTLHAGLSGGIVFVLWLLGHILPWISVATPWGAVAAAIISAVLTWLRKFLKDQSGIVYPQ